MQGLVIYDPLLPWGVLTVLALLVVGFLILSAMRGLAGWWLRGAAMLLVLGALANPSYQLEDRDKLNDIVLLVVDDTASQGLSDRPSQVAQAIEDVRARVAALENTELKIITLEDAPGDGGSLMMSRLEQALAELPTGRVAGAILLSDGQIHDIPRAPKMPAPMQLLLTGHPTDWDRRLIIRNAPAFAILGEPITLNIRIEDQGPVPADAPLVANLDIIIDGEALGSFQVPVGRDVEFPLTLERGGLNVVQFSIATQNSELTSRNNSALVQINGVRDRLRVLLISGEPYPGGRTWRNLLKSDNSVDLVHFTILRPPEKQDRAPVSELSLIAFPTRELFLDKIDQFDLIIFDRYQLRGILPRSYLDNVRQYVENGGAVLIAAGPSFASADSLYRSPLGDIIPASPTSRVIERGFRPQISEVGKRHPVTENLDQFAPPGEQGPGWGRWLRQVELLVKSGHAVLNGADDLPLLVLDRVGEGRIALLGSDQAWLWSRGYEGGGPQLELLRRLAHWMMKEPELEEEALLAAANGLDMVITRRTLGTGPREVEITGPDGSVYNLMMEQGAPGRFTASFSAPKIGLYLLRQGEVETVVALGPSSPREFEETIATTDLLAPILRESRGGVARLSDGFPDIRRVRPGRVAVGRGWIGITPRGAYLSRDVTVTPLVPGWLLLLFVAGLSLVAWLHEGRS